MLPLLNAGTDGIGTCQKRILGNVLRGVTALPRQCGSSRLPGSNSPPSSRAPGRNRPLCRRQPKIPHRPPTEKLRSARVGSSRRSQLTMRIKPRSAWHYPRKPTRIAAGPSPSSHSRPNEAGRAHPSAPRSRPPPQGIDPCRFGCCAEALLRASHPARFAAELKPPQC